MYLSRLNEDKRQHKVDMACISRCALHGSAQFCPGYAVCRGIPDFRRGMQEDD